MAWIEVHQSLVRHRKTLKLSARLGISRTLAIGHLVTFWLWAVDNAPDGDLTGLDPQVIAFGAEWEGDPNAFLEAMVDTGWIDEAEGRLLIHHWDEYAGRLIERREANRKRVAEWRRKRSEQARGASGTGNVTRTQRVTNDVRADSERVPYRATIPDLTVPDPNTPPPARENTPLPAQEPEPDSRPSANPDAIRLSAEYMDNPKFRPSGRRTKRAVGLRSDWALTDFDEAISQGLSAELLREAMQAVAPGSSPREVVAKARQLWERRQVANGRGQPRSRDGPRFRLVRFPDSDPEGSDAA